MLTEQQTTKWSSAVKKLIKTIDNKNSDKCDEGRGSFMSFVRLYLNQVETSHLQYRLMNAKKKTGEVM